MYQRDVQLIRDYVLHRGPDGLVDVVEFVLCTIQAGLSTVKMQRRDIQENGMRSRFLWGKKGEGLAYVEERKEYMWGKVHSIMEQGLGDASAIADCIEMFMEVPNLGLVKAAFVAQCLGFEVGCLDSHNLKRFGINPNRVKVSATLSPLLKRKKVLDYVQTCVDLGGSEYLWNSWCEYVAGNKANKALDTADVVSKCHVECIVM